MYQADKVHIVVKFAGEINQQIESVWTTPELAQSAIIYHAMNDMQAGFEYQPEKYTVIPRELNKAKKS